MMHRQTTSLVRRCLQTQQTLDWFLAIIVLIVIKGLVYTYQRGSNLRDLLFEETLELDTDMYPVSADHRFGADIDISSDGKYLIVGSSTASDVASNYKTGYLTSSAYSENDIVKYNENYWQAVRSIYSTKCKYCI